MLLFGRMIYMGLRRKLVLSDIWTIPKEHSEETQYHQFEKEWQKELARARDTLVTDW